MFKNRPTIQSALFSTRQTEREETQFWARLRLKNGVFKYTTRRRFDDINEWLIPLLDRSSSQIDVLDVAASSGITTVELSERLTQDDIPHRMVAADLSAMCWFVSTPLGDALLEKDGYPLQYDLLRTKALPSSPGTRSEFTLFRVLRLLTKLSTRHPSLKRRLRAEDDFTIGGCDFKLKPLMMKEVVDHPDVEISSDDILKEKKEWAGRFDLIRAANILQPGYFDDDTLRKMVENLGRRLKPSGQLFICRTYRGEGREGENVGTLYRKTSDGWSMIDRFADGCPIESLLEP